MFYIHPPIRSADQYALKSTYKAHRKNKLHRGIDLACYAGSILFAPFTGSVSKIGYPYDINHATKGYLRYIELIDINNIRHRFFYVKAYVIKGQFVQKYEQIGATQSLQSAYPGIIDHIHYEVMKGNKYIDPTQYLIKI